MRKKMMIVEVLLTTLLISSLASTFHAQLPKAEKTTHVEQGTIGPLSLETTDWNKTYGGTANDVASSLVQTGDGGYALAGYTMSSGAGNADFWLVKTDASGNQQWNKTYGGVSNDGAQSLVQTGDGGYALAGYTTSFGAGNADFWLVKTDASGNQQWNKTYGGTGNDLAYSLVQTGDGGYALAGYTTSFGAGNADFWLVKTNSSGNMLWNKTYGGTGDDRAYSLVQTGDGGYALAGYTMSSGAGGADFWLVKTDASGNQQWNKTYGGTGTDEAYSVVQTGDGGYALAGYTTSFGAGNADFWLVKTDASGNQQWNKTYGGTGNDLAYSLVQTGDGGYALAGYTMSSGAGGADSWLVKTDASGNQQWNKTYGGTGTDEAYSVVQTGDGGYALAGYTNSYGAGSYDFWLVKLTPTTIYINPDGSIYPSLAPIMRNGDVYTFTDNIYSSADVGIMIGKDDVTLDGAGYVLDGGGVGSCGIQLSATNVTVKNVNIHAFSLGIYVEGSSRDIIVGDNATACTYGIELLASSDNTVAGNHVTNSTDYGILLCQGEGSSGSPNNTLTGNTLTNDNVGISLSQSSSNFLSGNTIMASNNAAISMSDSSNNTVTDNNITDNYDGIMIDPDESSSNSFYHNNFVNNLQQVYIDGAAANSWDDGYPSGGNYWSDYNGTDRYSGPYQNETGSDGIGDTHYVINVNNQDNYPLMKTWSPQYTRYPWPMFHYDLTHAGYTESPAPGTNNKLWNYTTGNWVYSSPAVADGRVYVGSYDNRTYCLDAATGAQVWNYTTGNWVFSSPAVADDRVYVGSFDGRVYCLDAATGVQVWNYTTGNEVLSSPAVADDRVYVGSFDNRVYCLDASTGAQIWNYTTGAMVYSSPAVVSGRVYVGSWDNRTYCLDAATGAQIWNYTTGNKVYSSPAVADGRVYVDSYDNRTYCLDAATGAQIWNYTTGNWVYSSPAVADGRVYVGSWDNRTYCLDAATGAQIWNYTTGSYVFSSPAVADDRVYVGSSDWRVYCLDALTGAQVWNYTTGNGVFSSPAVADGVLYVGSEDGSVYAFGNVLRVPENYPTIQAAINAAAPGATVWVDPGVYHESLIINKTITLIGEPGSEPIFIDGGSGIAITIVSSGSGSTVAGITLTSWDQGILIQNASSCKIYDNIMSAINSNGIALQGTSAVNNQVYSNIFQQDVVAIDMASSSRGNTVSQNIIILSSVGLKLETSGNTVVGNMISGNQLGISLVNSDNNTIYHNDFVDNTQATQLTFSTSTGNKWDSGYPSGGNYWSSYGGVDLKSGPGQNIIGSDGIGDTPYTLAVNNTDNYPLTKPFNEYSIGIAGFAVAKTVVCRGFTCDMALSIFNYGLHDETFNVAVWAGQTRITLQTIVLTSRNSTQTTFTWNTTGFAYGNYTITSVADMVPGETSNADHNKTAWVIVSLVGDVTGPNGWPDGLVDMMDIGYVASHFLAEPTKPSWYPNADINGDNIVDMMDIGLAASHFLEHYP